MKRILLLFAALALFLPVARAEDKTPPPGLRILTAGHSFHFWMPKILEGVAASAGITGHQTIDVQYIGGSQVYAHWNVPDDKNKIKPVLVAGGTDVLTLSPIYLPDDGIEKFVQLGLSHNPNLKITVQEFWLPYDDQALWATRANGATINPDAKTIEELRAAHAPYFQSIDEEVRRVNEAAGQQAVFVVPVGQAVLALREKVIAGEAPGIKAQHELFSDPLGHPHDQIKLLSTYCHFAVIYRRSPIGLPVPEFFAKAPEAEKLNALLQQLAWDAVIHHPQSGVTVAAK